MKHGKRCRRPELNPPAELFFVTLWSAVVSVCNGGRDGKGFHPGEGPGLGEELLSEEANGRHGKYSNGGMGGLRPEAAGKGQRLVL